MLTTTTPKTISYRPNGGGRDTYILTNNGGMQSGMGRLPFRVEKGVYVSLKQPKMTRAKSSAKVVRYWADGTGRDVYVG